MNSKRGCIFLLFGLGGVVILTVGMFLFLNNATRQRLERLQTLHVPPTVYVMAPKANAVLRPGSVELVQVVSAGPQAVLRIELWLDGNKVDEEINENPDQTSAFAAAFPIHIDEGPHMLVARAVDSAGVIGQSLPLSIIGDPLLAAQETQTLAIAGEGQSLTDVAEIYAVDTSTLQAVNPALPSGTLPPGTQIAIPPSSNPQANVPGPAPSAPLPAAFAAPNVPMLELASQYLTINPFVTFAGSDNDKPVKAPSNLQLDVSECKLRLRWDDNAHNEIAYSIWLSEYGYARPIALLKPSASTGPAWVQIDIPPPGPYGFWVEAVNGLGAQKSEVAWIRIENHTCTDITARDLELTIEKYDIAKNSHAFYCYGSVEGRVHVRIPEGQDEFFNPPVSAAPFVPGVPPPPTPFVPGVAVPVSPTYRFPIPGDRELNLDLKCLEVPRNVGVLFNTQFEIAIPEGQWDGRSLRLDLNRNTLWYNITRIGNQVQNGTYAYIGKSITAPVITSVEPVAGSGSSSLAGYERQRRIKWQWSGSEPINGFILFLDGFPVSQVAANQREATIALPRRCGTNMRVEVAALSRRTQSPTDAHLVTVQPCPYQVTVDYFELFLDHADDDRGHEPKPYCSSDAMDAYFKFWASFNGTPPIERKYNYDSNIKYAMTCGLQKIDALTGGTDEISTTLAPSGTTISYSVGALFVDEDDFWDDVFADPELNFMVWAPDEGEIVDNTHVMPFETRDGRGWLKVRVTIKPWTL